MDRVSFDQRFGVRFPPQLAERVYERGAQWEQSLPEYIQTNIRDHLDATETVA